MARPLPVQQLELLEIVLRRFPKGASIPQLVREFTPPQENRTIQRWLGLLIDQHRAVQIEFGDDPRYGALSPPETAVSAMPAATSPAGETPANLQAQFAEMFAEAVLPIVIAPMAPGPATSALQLQAARNRCSNEQRIAYVVYAKKRLGELTLGEAETLGMFPEQFEAWHTLWHSAPTAPASPPEPTTTQATSPAASGAKSVAGNPAAEPEDPVVRLANPETPAKPAASAAPSDADELADVLGGIGLGGVAPMLKETVQLGKELFTWSRFGIAVAWGVAVTYAISTSWRTSQTCSSCRCRCSACRGMCSCGAHAGAQS